jgi:hypothetical protein
MPQKVYLDDQGNPTAAPAKVYLDEHGEPLGSSSTPIAADEPSTYAAGALKGAKEGIIGGAKGFAEGMLQSPASFAKGIVSMLTTNPVTTVKDAVAAIERLPDAIRSAGNDPEAWGQGVGDVTGQTMIGMAGPRAVAAGVRAAPTVARAAAIPAGTALGGVLGGAAGGPVGAGIGAPVGAVLGAAVRDAIPVAQKAASAAESLKAALSTGEAIPASKFFELLRQVPPNERAAILEARQAAVAGGIATTPKPSIVARPVQAPPEAVSAPAAETPVASPSTPQTAPVAAPAQAAAPPVAAPTATPAAFKTALGAFQAAGETPRAAEVANVASLIKKGAAPEQALKVVLGNRPGGAPAAAPLSPVEDLAARFNARAQQLSPLDQLKQDLVQGGAAEAEFARNYAAKQAPKSIATMDQPAPTPAPEPAAAPTPEPVPEPAPLPKPKPTRTPKAKATVVDAAPSTADTPAAAAERVIDVAGAVTGKDVQGRVVSALTEELTNAQQAAKFKTIEFSAGRPSSGSYGRIIVDDQPVAYVDKYGTIKWFDEPTSYTTAQGQRVAAPESPHGKMSLEGRMDEKTPGQIAREATTQVARQLGKEQGTGLLRVQIPGDGTFTVERNPHAIGELIRRINAGGPAIWQGVGNVKFSAPKVGPTIPKATW